MAKQIEITLQAVANGCSTSREVAENSGFSERTAAARLHDLEAMGLIARASHQLRNNASGPGRTAIAWRIKGIRSW